MDKFDPGDGAAPEARHAFLTSLGAEALDAMQVAADDVVECERILAKTGDTVVSDLLRQERDGGAACDDGRHIPEGDVYDPITHGQYYFHSHHDERPVDDPRAGAGMAAAELGHFHTFLRRPGMPDGVAPIYSPINADHGGDSFDDVSHLAAIGFSNRRSASSPGGAERLFTTNRWVTGGSWYRGSDVIEMLSRFEIDVARPSWPANRWITALFRLYRPELAVLIQCRDQELSRLAEALSVDVSVILEDRRHPVLSEIAINVPQKIKDVRAARRQLRRGKAGATPD